MFSIKLAEEFFPQNVSLCLHDATWHCDTMRQRDVTWRYDVTRHLATADTVTSRESVATRHGAATEHRVIRGHGDVTWPWTVTPRGTVKWRDLVTSRDTVTTRYTMESRERSQASLGRNATLWRHAIFWRNATPWRRDIVMSRNVLPLRHGVPWCQLISLRDMTSWSVCRVTVCSLRAGSVCDVSAVAAAHLRDRTRNREFCFSQNSRESGRETRFDDAAVGPPKATALTGSDWGADISRRKRTGWSRLWAGQYLYKKGACVRVMELSARWHWDNEIIYAYFFYIMYSPFTEEGDVAYGVGWRNIVGLRNLSASENSKGVHMRKANRLLWLKEQ